MAVVSRDLWPIGVAVITRPRITRWGGEEFSNIPASKPWLVQAISKQPSPWLRASVIVSLLRLVMHYQKRRARFGS